ERVLLVGPLEELPRGDLRHVLGAGGLLGRRRGGARRGSGRRSEGAHGLRLRFGAPSVAERSEKDEGSERRRDQAEARDHEPGPAAAPTDVLRKRGRSTGGDTVFGPCVRARERALW